MPTTHSVQVIQVWPESGSATESYTESRCFLELGSDRVLSLLKSFADADQVAATQSAWLNNRGFVMCMNSKG